MAPERRSRRRQIRWSHGHRRSNDGNQDDTIAGDPVRRVLDSYCPFCATDIRSVGPRRLARCPNLSLCGKVLPLDDQCCPKCRHYTRRGDNFCRVCRNNLRGVVRNRGGLYMALSRLPSPVQNQSPPRLQEPEPQQQQRNEIASGSGGIRVVDDGSATISRNARDHILALLHNDNTSDSDSDREIEPFRNPMIGNAGRNGTLRVVAIDDDNDDLDD